MDRGQKHHAVKHHLDYVEGNLHLCVKHPSAALGHIVMVSPIYDPAFRIQAPTPQYNYGHANGYIYVYQVTRQ